MGYKILTDLSLTNLFVVTDRNLGVGSAGICFIWKQGAPTAGVGEEVHIDTN